MRNEPTNSSIHSTFSSGGRGNANQDGRRQRLGQDWTVFVFRVTRVSQKKTSINVRIQVLFSFFKLINLVESFFLASESDSPPSVMSLLSPLLLPVKKPVLFFSRGHPSQQRSAYYEKEIGKRISSSSSTFPLSFPS